MTKPHPIVAAVVFGMTRPHHVAQTLDYLKETIPSAFWQALVDAGIIASGVPLPSAASSASLLDRG